MNKRKQRLTFYTERHFFQRRTKSRGPKGLQLEVAARRPPRLLVQSYLSTLSYSLERQVYFLCPKNLEIRRSMCTSCGHGSHRDQRRYQILSKDRCTYCTQKSFLYLLEMCTSCGQGSHRDQRRYLARLVDVHNVCGGNISTNMTWDSFEFHKYMLYLYLYLCLYSLLALCCKKSNEEGETEMLAKLCFVLSSQTKCSRKKQEKKEL